MNKKTIKKWFWVWDFEKEEIWLNQMAQSGWVLDGVGFCKYHFVQCEPGEYTVRLEMHEADDEYMNFMAETGAEFVGRMVQWVYFRKKAEMGAFDIFSDIDSRIGHLKKIGNMLSIVAAGNLLIGIGANANSAVPLGLINLACAALLAYALGRIHGKKEALEKERQIHE